MSPFDPAAGEGLPAPLVPPLPVTYRRTEILTAVYRTDAAAADRLIPAPLALADDVAIVHVYRMHDAEWFGVYAESAVHLPVALPDGTRAVFAPFLVLDSDGAVAAGRELYGQPKKAGQVVLESRGDLVVGEVARNGIGIITVTACYKQARARPGRLEEVVPGASVNVNLRVLPIDGPRMRRELVSRTFVDVVEHEAWESPATVELRPNAQVPVHLLPVREVVLGLHRVIDLTLPPGDVVHSYTEA